MSLELFFEQLNKEMTERPFLRKNPVLERVKNGKMSSGDLSEVIRQYVRFPEEIVQMLQGAAGHFPKNHPIYQELERNWGQESGSETGGIPHVEILKHRLEKDLSIDASRVDGSSATEQFLDTVHQGMKRDAWFALGQVYALEASAVPELAVLIGPAINAYASQVGKTQPIEKVALDEEGSFILPKITTPEEADAMGMSEWFALHIIDFEVGHRDFLREKASTVLTDDVYCQAFAEGFRNVLSAMDAWWFGLSEGK